MNNNSAEWMYMCIYRSQLFVGIVTCHQGHILPYVGPYYCQQPQRRNTDAPVLRCLTLCPTRDVAATRQIPLQTNCAIISCKFAGSARLVPASLPRCPVCHRQPTPMATRGHNQILMCGYRRIPRRKLMVLPRCSVKINMA